MAAVSFLIFTTEILARSYLHAASQARQLTLLAVQQFVPCLVAGGLLTYAIVVYVPTSVALLPGLWAIVFSLGIFASCRLLPPADDLDRGLLSAGRHGSPDTRSRRELALALGDGWDFGAGQLFAAVVLLFTLERNHGQT